MELGDWRKRIDALNLQLLELLNERAKCAQAIAELKKKKMLPIYDPLREKQVFEAVLGQNKGPLPDEAIRRIFECIILEHRRLEENT
ncbi:MAG: chorismate mutase [Fibrobacteres bacterium]|nr:chorismate mutase [Fibrobacterota bacterium]